MNKPQDENEIRLLMKPPPEGILPPSHWYYHAAENWWTCGSNSGQTWTPPHKPGDEREGRRVLSCQPIEDGGVYFWSIEVE